MNTIKYKNQSLPCKFNYRVIKTIKNEYGIDLTDQNQLQSWISDTDNQEILFFNMLLSGHKEAGKELNITLADMVDILSEDHSYADFLNVYQKDAIAFITPSNSKSETKSEEIKKKLKTVG